MNAGPVVPAGGFSVTMPETKFSAERPVSGAENCLDPLIIHSHSHLDDL